VKRDMLSEGAVAKGAGRYVVGEVERFDEKNYFLNRVRWDPSVIDLGEKYWARSPRENKPGYGLRDTMFRNAGYYLETHFAKGNQGGRQGLYAWESEQYGWPQRPPGVKLAVDDPVKITGVIKKAASFFGASLVGICELDRRWIYSHHYDVQTHESTPIDVPDECKYAIAIAIEMDYEAIKTSPSQVADAATTVAYSRMAFTAGTLAQYIRGLGYKAIPMGTDTALNIPIAIDAGLGELSRMGILITEKFGPRVRLSKVFTDLPLVPDKPVEFGVWEFCQQCLKCAKHCPGQAISYGEPTDKPLSISNNCGLLRWPINAEKCFRFWTANGAACNNCIRVCPFNKSPGWLHSLVRWMIKHVRWMNPLFIKMDDFFGYGRQVKAEHFWND